MSGIKEIGTEQEPLTWEDFERQVLNDIDETKQLQLEEVVTHSDWIYRGQSSSKWELLTTLERYLEDKFNYQEESYEFGKYYKHIKKIIPSINSLLKKKFEWNQKQVDELDRMGPAPNYELLCYARHMGYPSPLLDWTESYFIAAFFAFKSAKKGDNVSIFAYKEWNGDARGGWVSEPLIDQQGNYVETHERHYRQQSFYTLCKAEIETKVVLMKHQEAVKRNPENHNMKKFIIDGKEKEKVLEKLFMMNINDYTLFGDEEALFRTEAYKSFRKII